MKIRKYEIHTKEGRYYSIETDSEMKINKKHRLAIFGKDAVVNLDSVSLIYKIR